MPTIAAMQPYILPYIPYFQLTGAVDYFVILDDVQFIRRGWMNRNRILLNGEIHQVTFPVSHGQRQGLILDKRFPSTFLADIAKLRRTFQVAYGKADNWPVLRQLLIDMEARLPSSFLEFAEFSIARVCQSLGQNTPFVRSSSLGISDTLRGSRRILAICEALSASRYINPSGGYELYHGTEFRARNVELCFLEGTFAEYPQYRASKFVPGLSIADFLANCDPDKYSDYLIAKLKCGS